MQRKQATPNEGQLRRVSGAGTSAPASLRPRPRAFRLPLPAARSARVTFLSGLALAALILLFGNRTAALYTDYLWARSLGYGDLWHRLYGTRLVLLTGFGATSFLLAYLNVRLADYLSPSALVNVPPVPAVAAVQTPRKPVLFGITGGFGDGPPLSRTLQWLASLRPVLDRLLLGGALLFAVGAGLSAQAEWNSFLRFTHPVRWGQTDPLWNRDVGFYVFTLPWLRYVQGWLLTVFLLIGAGVTVVYVYQQGINWIGEHHARVDAETRGKVLPGERILQPIPPPVRAHLSGLLCAVLLAKGWGYYLDRFDLMYDTSGSYLTGAGYTDVHVRLPLLAAALWIIGFAGLAALLNVWRRGFRLPLLALVVWLGFSGVGVVSPGAVQRLLVQPNEAVLEGPYLARAIAATRAGYGLDAIESRPLRPAPPDLPPAPALWANVPLWESSRLLSRWERDAPMPAHERIVAVHKDRYALPGDGAGRLRTRIVAIGAHEITRQDLQGTAQTWLNRHLYYTHGRGVTASLAGEGTDTSDPMQAGVPPLLTAQTAPGLVAPPDAAPPVYFGLADPDDDYALLPWSERNPPQAGVPLTSLARAALAARFATWSLLTSRAINARTRVLPLRSVSEQVKRIAPFLLIDPAPHPVVSSGRVFWLVPAYTTTSAYPNALLTRLTDNWGPTTAVNYLRPSVLAVVDAETGQVRLYAADDRFETDPLLQSYRAAFPGVLLPASDLPPDLRAHRRYPLGLLTLQRQVIGLYHTTDPTTFYRRASVWDAPRESKIGPEEATPTLTQYDTGFLAEAPEPSMSIAPPRYGLAQIDAEIGPEFVLQSPLVGRGTGRVAGLLVGRSDGKHFGSLVLYQAASDGNAADALLAPDLLAHRWNEAAALSGLYDGRAATTPTGIVTSSGPVRMVVQNGYVRYIEPVWATGRAPKPDASSFTDDGSEAERRFLPLPRLWRVRIGDGQRVAEAATIEQALQKLSKGSQ